MIDDSEDYEVYSNSDGKEGVDMEIMDQNESSEQLYSFPARDWKIQAVWQQVLLCQQTTLGGKAAEFYT